MTGIRIRALAVAAIAAAGGGCGLGPGEASEGEASLTVTREYGTVPMLEATISDPPEAETVIRFLDREAEIATRYGGGFVHSIDDLAGEISGGRSRDWFFFVNGVESSTGSAEVEVDAGDRIWWDYRDWTDAMRVPVVVGSWPEPFAQLAAGTDRVPVRVDCATLAELCDTVGERLADEGVEASVEPLREADASGDRGEAMRVVVGPWERLRHDPLASQLADGPATSGVFARFEAGAEGSYALLALDEHASTAERLGAGSGLVAGLRSGEDPPGWVVTGTDAEGVAAAAALIDGEHLGDRYALATGPGAAELALPAEAGP